MPEAAFTQATIGDSEFDRDTALTRREPGVYDIDLSAGWTIISAVNGGYLLAVLGRALAGGRRAFGMVALFTMGASAAYFGWHVLFEQIAPQISDGPGASDRLWQVVVGGLAVLFVAQSIMQTRPNGRFSTWLQPHLDSGLYIDDWFTRVTFRLWPPAL